MIGSRYRKSVIYEIYAGEMFNDEFNPMADAEQYRETIKMLEMRQNQIK